MKKKKIIILLIGLTFLFISWQFYMANKYGGNLIVNISNQSKLDTVKIELYLDGKKQLSDLYTNEAFHSYKESIFNTKLGKHTLIIKAENNKVTKEIKVNTFFVTWIVVDFYEDSNTSGNIFLTFYVRKHLRPFFIQ